MAVTVHRTAIFRQINKESALTHHDALEFPDGKVVLLTRPPEEADGQKRLPITA